VKEDNRRPFERPSFDDVQRTVANGDVGGRNAASPAVVELSSCGVVVMGYTLIQQKELRNQVGQVLRRVEAGESLIVTVSGRPVAELSPVRRHRWVSGPAVTQVWRGPAPRALEGDLGRLDAGLVDAFDA